MRSSNTRTSRLRPSPPRWRHEHDEQGASAHSGPDLPTAPPALQVRGAVDKAWTSPAALDSALTEIGPGRVQRISEPRYDLSDRFDILSRPSHTLFDEMEDDETDGEDAGSGSGSGSGKVKLLPWTRRKAEWLGHEGPGGRTVPLIDRVHRLMHFSRAGDEARVNGYIDDHGLARHTLFARLQHALIEVAPVGSEERAILESLSNHIAARAGLAPSRHAALGLETPS